jgi:hypothetical protein
MTWRKAVESLDKLNVVAESAAPLALSSFNAIVHTVRACDIGVIVPVFCVEVEGMFP